MELKRICFIFCIILLVGIVNAEENNCGSQSSFLGTFKQNDTIQLLQICDDCTYVNFTSMKYPNGEYESFNLGMTKTNQNFNYTFSNTSKIGCYIYTVAGDKGGIYTMESIYFEVTPSGYVNTLGFYFLIFILSLGIILLGFNREDPTIVLLGTFGLYFVGFYMLFNGIDGIKDTVYTWGISIITLGLAFYLSSRSSFELIND